MLVRLPSSVEYADKVAKEQYWLPKLAPQLSFAIPEPLAQGKLTDEYPWPWSIYCWIEGEAVASANIMDLSSLAYDLAKCLIALQQVDTSGGPPAGAHNFYRGGSLANYDIQTRQAIGLLKDKIDAHRALETWNAALATTWTKAPVWIHGDISPGNLLVCDGKLCAVIDFGGLAIGDPACDLAIAWTFFDAGSREVFKQALKMDEGTWLRGKAWALWKAVIVAAGLCGTNAVEKAQAWPTLEAILSEVVN